MDYKQFAGPKTKNLQPIKPYDCFSVSSQAIHSEYQF